MATRKQGKKRKKNRRKSQKGCGCKLFGGTHVPGHRENIKLVITEKHKKNLVDRFRKAENENKRLITAHHTKFSNTLKRLRKTDKKLADKHAFNKLLKGVEHLEKQNRGLKYNI